MVTTKMVKKTTWFLYMLYSVKTGKVFTGVSRDPQARLRLHNSGKGAKATKSGGPWRVVYVESYRKREEAIVREHEVRCLSKAQKLLMAGLSA